MDAQSDTAAKRTALTALVVENAELERLEALLGQFNIFAAIGVERQELRHSAFMSFLLDPMQPHGLGDAFAKRLLQRVLTSSPSRVDLTPIHLDLWSLGSMTVAREWRNIDLLLTDAPNQIAVVIENKIDSGEHSGQLRRYRTIVSEHFAGWKHLFVFLTPAGDAPSDDAYLSLDYGTVSDLVESLAERRRSSLEPTVHAIMTHYARMLRRYVVTDSEIAELCLGIYQKHRQALDLIIKHIPSAQTEMASVLVELIDAVDGLTVTQSTKGSVSFILTDWDTTATHAGEGPTTSWHQLFFEWKNRLESLDLALVVGPGSASTRDALIGAAHRAGSPFSVGANPGKVWTQIFKEGVLKPADFASKDPAERIELVRQFWVRFVEDSLQLIRDALEPDVFKLQQSPTNPPEGAGSAPGNPVLNPGGTS